MTLEEIGFKYGRNSPEYAEAKEEYIKRAKESGEQSEKIIDELSKWHIEDKRHLEKRLGTKLDGFRFDKPRKGYSGVILNLSDIKNNPEKYTNRVIDFAEEKMEEQRAVLEAKKNKNRPGSYVIEKKSMLESILSKIPVRIKKWKSKKDKIYCATFCSLLLKHQIIAAKDDKNLKACEDFARDYFNKIDIKVQMKPTKNATRKLKERNFEHLFK